MRLFHGINSGLIYSLGINILFGWTGGPFSTSNCPKPLSQTKLKTKGRVGMRGKEQVLYLMLKTKGRTSSFNLSECRPLLFKYFLPPITHTFIPWYKQWFDLLFGE